MNQNIGSVIYSIFNEEGKNSNLWEILKNILQNNEREIEPFCEMIKIKIDKGNKQEKLLSLKIINFAIDIGRVLLWEKIDSKYFLESIINLLRLNLDKDIQNTCLDLINSIYNKFKNYPSLQNWANLYKQLKNSNINFPINNSYINLKKIKMESNDIRKSRIPSNPDDYLQNINLDLNPLNYEKKYYRLVNKLSELTVIIAEMNCLINSKMNIPNTNFINNNNNNNNDQILEKLYESLYSGKTSLLKAIQGDKLSEEKLMSISLNIMEDINMTLDRYDKLKQGQNPGPFLTSFSRNNNPYYKKKTLSEKKLNKLDELGFGDTVKTIYLDEEAEQNFNRNSLNMMFGKVYNSEKLVNQSFNPNNNAFNSMSVVSNGNNNNFNNKMNMDINNNKIFNTINGNNINSINNNMNIISNDNIIKDSNFFNNSNVMIIGNKIHINNNKIGDNILDNFLLNNNNKNNINNQGTNTLINNINNNMKININANNKLNQTTYNNYNAHNNLNKNFTVPNKNHNYNKKNELSKTQYVINKLNLNNFSK